MAEDKDKDNVPESSENEDSNVEQTPEGDQKQAEEASEEAAGSADDAAAASSDEAPADDAAAASSDEAPADDAAAASSGEAPADDAAAASSGEAPADDAAVASSDQAPADEAAADEVAVASSDEAPAEDDKVVNPEDASEGDAEAAMMAMLDELPDENSNATPEDIDFGSAKVAKAEFQHLSENAEKPEPRNIDLLMDVNLPVSIELGRTKMTISDILALGPGSVVELSKLAGEPVDVLVNNNAVARGEVVVIDENFGVRITQLMTAEERLRSIADER